MVCESDISHANARAILESDQLTYCRKRPSVDVNSTLDSDHEGSLVLHAESETIFHNTCRDPLAPLEQERAWELYVNVLNVAARLVCSRCPCVSET